MEIKDKVNFLIELSNNINAKGKRKCYVLKGEDNSYKFVKKKEASIQDLSDFVKDVFDNAEEKDKPVVNECLESIKKRLLKKSSGLKLFGTKKRNNIDKLIANIKTETNEVKSEKQALCRFYREFDEIFTSRPKAMEDNEKKLISKISEKIWGSENVNNVHDKYTKYKELMTEYFIGSHMVFVDEDLDSMTKDLKCMKRESTHYGVVGAEKQKHIMGKQLPEVLFNEGEFGFDEEGKIQAGVYHHNVVSKIAKKKLKLIPEDKQEKYKTKKKCFWIQTERTPDGPRFGDWLYHRTIDFVHYITLKKILKAERPQIARYKARDKSRQRGTPDNKPIVIEKSE